METKEFWQIIWKNIWLIIIILVLFVAAAIIMTVRKPAVYQSSAAVEINRVQTLKQSQAPYFQYDNYYSVQVAGTLAGNMVEWLASPSMVERIYQKAGYSLPPQASLKDLAKIFTATKKLSNSNVVSVAYSSSDKVQSEKIINAVGDVMKERIAEDNKNDNSAQSIVNVSQPIVVEQPKQTALNAITAGVVGLFLGLGISFVKDGLKR